MDPDTFECLQCGKMVYAAANDCPHCGLEFYPEGDDEEEGGVTEVPMQVRPRVSAVMAIVLRNFLGPLITIVGVIGLVRLPVQPFTPYFPLLAGLLGAFAAGYAHEAFPLRGLHAQRWVWIRHGVINALLALWLLPITKGLFTLPTLIMCVLCTLAAYAGGALYRHLLRAA